MSIKHKLFVSALALMVGAAVCPAHAADGDKSGLYIAGQVGGAFPNDTSLSSQEAGNFFDLGGPLRRNPKKNPPLGWPDENVPFRQERVA